MEWISVKDRLPKDGRDVLVCYYCKPHLNMRFINVLSYFAFDSIPHWQHESIGIVVTHWMDLPEPPKGE